MTYRIDDQYVTVVQIAPDGVTLIQPGPFPPAIGGATPGSWVAASAECLTPDGLHRIGDVWWCTNATYWSDDPFYFVTLVAGGVGGLPTLRWVPNPTPSLVQDASTLKLVFPPLPPIAPVGP